MTAHNNSTVLEQMHLLDHEQVVFCHDKDTNLKAIIAVHNTVLGPSLGGCRFWKYDNEQQALTDVLRLSRGMTYKSSITGLDLGGGKSVIIGDPATLRSESLMRRFGRFINSLGGKYIVAEDMNTGTEDMEYIHKETSWVTGIPVSAGGSGNPSPFTAYGVYLGMKACAKELWGNDSLQGRIVAVQGVGSVGDELIGLLVKAGAKVTATDINAERLEKVCKKHNVASVKPDAIYDLPMDIYAPCAMGASVNSNTLSRLKCTIIAGSANNQLEDEHLHSGMIKEKGIIYAPDFLINAGGVINVAQELEGYNEKRATERVENIYSRTLEIFHMADTENLTTHSAALRLAEKRIHDIARIKARL